MKWIGMTLIAGGTWIFQDSLASVLYYIGRENWHYNQSLRLLRTFWGIVFVAIGVLIIMFEE